MVVEPASVWGGCLESQDIPELASRLGTEQTQLVALLEPEGASASQPGGCFAYAAATGGEAGVASASFLYTETDGVSRTLALQKTPDGILATARSCDCHESRRRVLTLPAWKFTDSLNAVSPSIPPNVRWQLNILVPRMIEALAAGTTTGQSVKPGSDEEPEAGRLTSGSEPQETEEPVIDHAIRVVLSRYGFDEREGLESVEIVEQDSGRRLTGAWWLDRPDGPGVLIGKDGINYERLLWESPVKYVRSARGVGASVTTVRRRVPAKKGSEKSTVVQTIKVPDFHQGIDMTAPKGTDVHAVGDAKVGFAGRKNGFGNVIILDHGDGYQTYYAHLSKIQKGIKAGVHVARGDIIGLVGSTGHSTAPHLHFETRKNNLYLDPFDASHELGFWLLTADEQERLEMQLLSTAPVAAGQDSANLQPGPPSLPRTFTMIASPK